MLKPFVLDMSSPAYEKQFERCKLDQALLGNHGKSRDYMRPGSRPMDASNSPADLQHHESGSHHSSPHYNPYPKHTSSSFLEAGSSRTLCVRFGFLGHRVAACIAKQSS